MTPKSSFKLRALATPNQVDRETAPERDLVPELTVTSFQEKRTKFIFSEDHFCFVPLAGSSEIMPDRCAVAGYSNIPDAEKNIPDAEKGIALKKFHFMVTIEAKRRPEGRNGRTS